MIPCVGKNEVVVRFWVFLSEGDAMRLVRKRGGSGEYQYAERVRRAVLYGV